MLSLQLNIIVLLNLSALTWHILQSQAEPAELCFLAKRQRIQSISLLSTRIERPNPSINPHRKQPTTSCKLALLKQQIVEHMQELRKRHPYFFLVIISLIMLFIYFCIVKLLLLDMRPWQSGPATVFLIFYHLVFALLVWSIVQTIRSDPGRVPLQWGFGLSNPTRKYCLICHVYKPERTHHCSSCSRCVLNMDHHCPWINSCIGFNNRKFFILMLFYTILITLINMIAFALSVGSILSNFGRNGATYILNTIVVTAAIVLNTIIFVTILLFFKFHLELVFSNQTTLQTLELKRQGKNPEQLPSDYDLGRYYNWVQVFGRNSCMWFFPIFLANEGPAGDGVIWPKRPKALAN